MEAPHHSMPAPTLKVFEGPSLGLNRRSHRSCPFAVAGQSYRVAFVEKGGPPPPPPEPDALPCGEEEGDGTFWLIPARG